jgi:PadR family transcriptional regulator PadR
MSIQASGALLDACVLSLLAVEDAYGYVLTQRMKIDLGVSESTLYPVMRRLQTEGCLTVYDVPHNGRNRRYYNLKFLNYYDYKPTYAVRNCIQRQEP